MPSLESIGERFENTMLRLDGFPFKGVIIPLDDSTGVSYDFSEPRISIRVRQDSKVDVGDVVLDPAGRRYLLASHDEPSLRNTVLYRTHLAFPMNSYVQWQRPTAGVVDPLTKLPRGSGKQDLGYIHALIEMTMREEMDNTIRVREQSHRLITAHPVQLNDIVDNRVVKRVDFARGVWVAEIE